MINKMHTNYKMHFISLMLMVFFISALFLVEAFILNIHPTDGVMIDTAAFHPLDEEEKNENSNWSSVALPHDWLEQNSNYKVGFYRCTVNIDKTPEGTWAIFIPKIIQNVDVYINGYWIDHNRISSKNAHYWNEPFIARFDGQHLKQGKNTLLIELTGHSSEQNYISKIYLGEASVITNSWLIAKAFRTDSVKIINFFIVAIEIIVFVLWRQQRSNRVYFPLLLGCMTLWFYNQDATINEIYFDINTWNLMISLAFGWSISFLSVANFNALDFPKKNLIKLIYLYNLAGLLLLIPFNQDLQSIFLRLWQAGMIVIFVANCIYLYQEFLKNNNKLAVYLFFASSLSLFLGIHDLLASLAILQRQSQIGRAHV